MTLEHFIAYVRREIGSNDLITISGAGTRIGVTMPDGSKFVLTAEKSK
jgi:hypothetical protein